MTVRRVQSAFTLIELLAVIAIISLLTVLAASALGGALAAYRLAIGADSLAGRLESARLLASTKNQIVEFRLIKPSGEDWEYFQVLLENEVSGELVPHGSILHLSDGVRLFTDTIHGGMLTLPIQSVPSGTRFAGAAYTGVRFHPSGHVEEIPNANDPTPVTSSNSFLTLAPAGSDPDLPANWIVIQVDTKTGAVMRFQP